MTERGIRQNERSRDDRAPRQYGKPGGESGSRFAGEPAFKKKKYKPGYTGQKQPAGASAAKPAFDKKAKNNRHG